jgi:hypothetical protein
LISHLVERQGVIMGHLKIGTTNTVAGRKGRRENTLYLQKIVFDDGSEFISQPELD